MAKYRKRPIIIEAEQFVPDRNPWPEGVYKTGLFARIDTPEGPLKVSTGDWIITGIKGEKYPCKPDVFAATYDEVPQ